MQYIVVVKSRDTGEMSAVGGWSKEEYAQAWIDKEAPSWGECEIVKMFHPSVY